MPELTHIATVISTLHHDCMNRWQPNAITLSAENFLKIVEENHAFNYQLWHAEDRARREDMGFEFVYQAKREIDHCNQQRNNRMEAMDEWLVQTLSPALPNSCPVHSETPGMIIDRLSILTLKNYYMQVQVNRQDVDKQHQQTCQQKLTTLALQQQQLITCLQELINEILSNKRTFRIYHQFKMYNDPALNPELYLYK